MKDCKKSFLAWTGEHQHAFESIKALLVSRECLTVIDHSNPGDNKIFVTCNMSDFHTGAVLIWGKTWETAHPTAFDSMQLKDAQKHYPVHEKELLAIVHALKKWRSDLLSSPILIYTDHRTLENFETQKDLLWRQARWMEHMSQFDMTITYIQGEDNTVADALLRLPANIPDMGACPDVDVANAPLRWEHLLKHLTINAVLKILADKTFLCDVQKGYESDEFCKKLSTVDCSISDIHYMNNLWYIGDRLVIPRYGML